MAPTIYARVSQELKAAIDSYTADNRVTLTSAVTDLLEEGLQAKNNQPSIVALEERVAEQNAELARLRQRDAVVMVVAERMRQPVGVCPACEKQVTGRDLLAVGHCPHCKASLTDVLAENRQPERAGLNEGDVKGVLSILGVLLAVAFLAQD